MLQNYNSSVNRSLKEKKYYGVLIRFFKCSDTNSIDLVGKCNRLERGYMKTLKIELINDYYIEVDELNHTLKQRYIGKDKDGNKKDAERIIGYFPDVQACVERLFRLVVLDETDKTVISLKEYAESAERAFLKIKEWRIKQ